LPDFFLPIARSLLSVSSVLVKQPLSIENALLCRPGAARKGSHVDAGDLVATGGKLDAECGSKLYYAVAKDRFGYFRCVGRNTGRTRCAQRRYVPAAELASSHRRPPRPIAAGSVALLRAQPGARHP
jgi:hypothetical protein